MHKCSQNYFVTYVPEIFLSLHSTVYRWHNPNVFNVIQRLVISRQGRGKDNCILKHSEEAMKVGKHNRTFANDIFVLHFYFMVEIFSSFMIYKNRWPWSHFLSFKVYLYTFWPYQKLLRDSIATMEGRRPKLTIPFES